MQNEQRVASSAVSLEQQAASAHHGVKNDSNRLSGRGSFREICQKIKLPFGLYSPRDRRPFARAAF